MYFQGDREVPKAATEGEMSRLDREEVSNSHFAIAPSYTITLLVPIKL